MTVERTTLLAIPIEIWENDFAPLASRAERTAARHRKAAPGDRREAIRYEGLCRDLERKAREFQAGNPDADNWDLDEDEARRLHEAYRDSRHPWSRCPSEVHRVLGEYCSGLSEMEGQVKLFQLRHVFDRGITARACPSEPGDQEEKPLEIWRTPGQAVNVAESIERRWCAQLEQAVDDGTHPLVPSGVNNAVLSRELRDFVATQQGKRRVDVRVVYRDGSEAARFPLHAVTMKDEANRELPVLRVALMSMRHPEMDPLVDAAWLRNKPVSGVKRPAAETDQFVYETSQKQLEELCEAGLVSLHVFQTGFEPAVIGFYRAVTERLRDHPGSIEVIPFYFHERPKRLGAGNVQNPEDCYERGKPWATQ